MDPERRDSLKQYLIQKRIPSKVYRHISLLKNGHEEFFAHETALIDEGVKIEPGINIWHFSHTMTGSIIGGHCNMKNWIKNIAE